MQSRLNPQQRELVTKLHAQGRSVSQIATRLGLTREYVQAYVSYLNRTGQ